MPRIRESETTMTKPRLFSGMQPSADSLHLGNYLGALVNWRQLQEEYDAFFTVVDLHAITQPYDPAQLAERTRVTAAQYFGAGIDPEKCTLYVQSQVPQHAQLQWLLGCITGFGEASRMTQFKDKSQRYGAEATTVGLFTYPVLMAADILLFDAEVVPVGDDQRQHIELTRTLAERFNSRFGETFTVPKGFVPADTARVYDLQTPESKMSKSAQSDAGLIRLLDDANVTRKKIMRAVTDNDGVVRFDRENKPGVSNLMAIHSALTGQSLDAIEAEFEGRGYGDLKKAVVESVEVEFGPAREKAREYLADPAELDRILHRAAEHAAEVAQCTLDRAMRAMGFAR